MLKRLDALMAHATKIFGDWDKIREWLGSPCQDLDGRRPVELTDSKEHIKELEDLLQKMEQQIKK